MNQKLDEILSDRLNKFASIINKYEASIYSSSPLTPSQINYLELINELEKPTVTSLSNLLGFAKPTVTITVNKLLEKGYLIKSSREKDRRTFRLEISDKGKELLKELNLERNKIAGELSKTLSKKEMVQFAWLLNKIIESHSI